MSNQNLNNNPPSRFVAMKEACEIVGLSRATIWREQQKPHADFPKPIKLTVGRVAFLRSELEAWTERRIAASRQDAA